MTTKQDVRKAYEKCNIYASKHTAAITEFGKLCEEYYGFMFGDVSELQDNDYIIETIDYGTVHLDFEEFHGLMKNSKRPEEE